jgi:hypothetical protein
MSWTQSDIDALKAAIAGGAVLQSMTFGDQTFTFRSMDEMLQALAQMQADVSVATGAGRSRLAATSKGV